VCLCDSESSVSVNASTRSLYRCVANSSMIAKANHIKELAFKRDFMLTTSLRAGKRNNGRRRFLNPIRNRYSRHWTGQVQACLSPINFRTTSHPTTATKDQMDETSRNEWKTLATSSVLGDASRSPSVHQSERRTSRTYTADLWWLKTCALIALFVMRVINYIRDRDKL